MKYFSTVCCLLCMSPSVLTMLLSTPATREIDEEEWVRLHGTHKKFSGCWPLARYFRTHLDELKVFCAKAHQQWTNVSVTTQEAYVNHWRIHFEDSRRKPIWADMIMYAEDRERPQPQVLAMHFMVKGNRADCVFYMKQVRRYKEEGTEMKFAEHVCGITGYEEFESNKCDV